MTPQDHHARFLAALNDGPRDLVGWPRLDAHKAPVETYSDMLRRRRLEEMFNQMPPQGWEAAA